MDRRSRSSRRRPARYGSCVASRKRVTIKDVAAATGLSPAAVSYALRGLQTSPETQERVRAAPTARLHRQRRRAALARGRTGLVGVLTGSLEDLGEQRFVETLGRQLGRHDLHMMLVDAQGDPEREGALARQLADQLVDGLVVSPLNPGRPGRGRRSARRSRWSRSATRSRGRPWARCCSTTAPASRWSSSTSTASGTGASP